MLLHEAPADRLRQVGEGQRSERRPGRGPEPPIALGRVHPGLVGDFPARHVKEEAAPLVPEPLDDLGSYRGLAGRDPRETPQHVGDHLAEQGAAGAENAAGIPVETAIACDQKWEERAGVCAQTPDRIELRRGIEPRLVRLDDPEQPVAVEVAVRLEPAVVGGDPRLRGRVAHGDPPRPGQQRGLDRGCVPGLPRGHVVGPAALPVDGAVPEDRVADEPIVGTTVQQAAKLALGARAVEAAPDDRVEARVPVPLPWVVPGAGPRIAEANPIPVALDPVALQRLLGNAEDLLLDVRHDRGFGHQAVMRFMPRSAKKVSTAARPISVTSPGHVSAQLTSPTNPCRAASTTWVTGLYLATV